MSKRLLITAIFSLFISVIYFGCSKEEEPAQFSLTVRVSPNGGGSVNPSSGIYDDGEQLSISATPSEGYVFSKWSGDISGNYSPLNFKITADTEITAEFVIDDQDGDGVVNDQDDCPNTPSGQEVDENGCSASQIDTDGDGINDNLDQCPDTPDGEEADEQGCSLSQKDNDQDGVNDSLDECPNTPEGENVNEVGCSTSQTDTDGDGVADSDDQCPDTPSGEEADEFGCSSSQTDTDGDGVMDDMDQCPDTPADQYVDDTGCSDSQKDTDGDGVTDDIDQCADSPSGSSVDEFGCADSQTDGDEDGVTNDQDLCPNTPTGETVDANGCSDSQKDSDGDGVTNENDSCPNTPSGESVDANGCSDSQKDSDGDGINDNVDECPNTPSGEDVNPQGCSASQRDSDGDGVSDADDQCPNTPSGQDVDNFGCSATQSDTDGDGVSDDIDLCPNTPVGETVDSGGCSPSQKDTDGDGIMDDIDNCPDTPYGESADAEGCSDSQKDTDEDGVTDDKDQCPNTPAGVNVDANGCEIVSRTYVPDDAFEQFLIDQGYDDVLDDYVLTDNIRNVEELNIIGYQYQIRNLIGLEDFNSLLTFRFYENGGDLEFLDLSKNTLLEKVVLERTGLNSLEISNHPSIKSISLDDESYSTLIIENNIKLEFFGTSMDGASNFESVSISNNPILASISLNDANISNMAANNNISLRTFLTESTSISRLDLSTNNNLERIGSDFPILGLEYLNITTLTMLKFVYINGENLTSIDLTDNVNLETLRLRGYAGDKLDVSNNPVLIDLSVTSPNLTCVKVSESQLNNIPSTWSIPANAVYSLDCNLENKTYVPDDAFEQFLIDQGYDDILDDYVLTDNIRNVEELIISIQNQIRNLTGLEDFNSLITFQLYENYGDLEFLDFSKNTLLETVIIVGSGANSLEISNHPSIKSIFLMNEEYTTLTIENNLNLESFSTGMEGASSFELVSISNNPVLGRINLDDTYIANMVVNNNISLRTIGWEGIRTEFTHLDLSTNPNLENIFGNVSQASIESININSLVNLKIIELILPSLISIDVSTNINLEKIEVSNTAQTSLDVSNNSKLIDLLVGGPNLTCIQVSEEQLNNIPATWSIPANAVYSLDCN